MLQFNEPEPTTNKTEGKRVIMEDKELKKRLRKIPDVDKNGDPIYKIDIIKNESAKQKDKSTEKDNKIHSVKTNHSKTE